MFKVYTQNNCPNCEEMKAFLKVNGLSYEEVDVNEDTKAMMITSSVPGEGKSFVAANLAASFAQYNEKVLLIDCDLRKGRQKKIFNIPEESDGGLSNLLIDDDWKKNLKDYIRKTEIKNLDIITTGSIPPNPTVLLESEKLEKVIEEFKDKYDVIIFDTPPVGGLTDALIMSRLADAVLIVARAKKTTIEMLENTKEALKTVGANIVGVILNRVDNRDDKYYKNYYTL